MPIALWLAGLFLPAAFVRLGGVLIALTVAASALAGGVGYIRHTGYAAGRAACEAEARAASDRLQAELAAAARDWDLAASLAESAAEKADRENGSADDDVAAIINSGPSCIGAGVLRRLDKIR